MSYDVSIIHPSRQRPELALETAKKWWQYVDKNKCQYILSVDVDDPTIERYKELFRESDIHYKMLIYPNHTAIEAINEGAKQATGDLLIVISDDFDCPDNWYVLLRSALIGRSDFVVKTIDGCQPWIITLPIMDRAYYERFGYIYYPGYSHMFCDTEMSHVGDLLDKTIKVSLKFPHRHYTQAGGQKFDMVNQKNNATWMQGEALYLERLKNNFGLTEFEGKLNCAPHHIVWLASKGIAA